MNINVTVTAYVYNLVSTNQNESSARFTRQHSSESVDSDEVQHQVSDPSLLFRNLFHLYFSCTDDTNQLAGVEVRDKFAFSFLLMFWT